MLLMARENTIRMVPNILIFFTMLCLGSLVCSKVLNVKKIHSDEQNHTYSSMEVEWRNSQSIGLKNRVPSSLISLPVCTHVRVTSETSQTFLRRLEKKQANFAVIKVRPQNSSLIQLSQTPEVMFKTVWVWTLLGEGGAFPYLWYDYQSYQLSLGLLNQKTLHSSVLNLTTSSTTPCTLMLGAVKSTKTLANAFNEMMLKTYQKNDRYQRSVFCYTVRYRSYGRVMYYITHLIGTEKGYTGYKCCYFYVDRDDTNTTKIRCEENIQKLTEWYCVLYFISFVCFFYCPLVIFPVAARLALQHTTPDTPSIKGYEMVKSRTSESSEDILEEGNVLSERHGWIYLGVDKPITLFKLVCKPFSIFHSYPILGSRLQRLITILLSSSVILLKLIVYRKAITEQQWIQRRIEKDIPVGFLALPFGFSASKRNWGNLFGGPYVMYTIYFTLGAVMFVLPSRFCRTITCFLKQSSERPWTILSLDLRTVEAWGSLSFKHHSGYNFILEVLSANFYMLLNTKFWYFVFQTFIERARNLNNKILRNFGQNCVELVILRLIQFIVFSVYACLCLLEVISCVLYYGLPSVFLAVVTLRGYIGWAWSHAHQSAVIRILTGIFVTAVTLHCLIAFAILFICSIIFIILVIDFTYIGIMVGPHYTVSYVIGTGTLAFYLVGNIRKFNDKFSNLLAKTVEASTELENRRKTNLCSFVENTIILTGKSATCLEFVRIEGGPKIRLSADQKNTLLKARKTSEPFVKWRNNQPGIPYELFRYVMRKFCPLHVEIFWFLFRLAVFCFLVVSIVTLLLSYNISENLSIANQLITIISLNVMPRILELCTSSLDTQLADEHWKRCLQTAVDEYWAQQHHDYVTV